MTAGLRAIGAMLLLVLLATGAFAASGVTPTPGFGMPDGTWLQGLANGVNQSYTSGLTAAGTNQATSLPIPANYALVEVDTTSASTGVSLPFAIPGTEIKIYNNGASTLTIYPAIANNPATGAQDTINNTTSTTAATHVSMVCFSAKVGIWACK